MPLLIDADAVAFRATVVNERDERFDDRVHVLWSDFDSCTGVFENMLADLCDQANNEDVILFWSKGRNFRFDIDPTYKGNRKGFRKPLAYHRVVEWAQECWDSIEHDTLEADDAIGIYATDPENSADENIIWSPDKDLLQIPAFHLRDDEVVEVTPEEGQYWHMKQTLIGDTADGYPGCPGVGEGAADNWLTNWLKPVPFEHEITRGKNKGKIETRFRDEDADTYWEIVMAAYAKAGLTEEDALRQARLAYILQHPNFVDGEVFHWTPERKRK